MTYLEKKLSILSEYILQVPDLTIKKSSPRSPALIIIYPFSYSISLKSSITFEIRLKGIHLIKSIDDKISKLSISFYSAVFYGYYLINTKVFFRPT